MNILYLGGYRQRFMPVVGLISDLPANSRILELCFGDTYVARNCQKRGYMWKGIDINQHFVAKAQKSGHDAYCADILQLETLPAADACIIMGSLYHFHLVIDVLIDKIFRSCNTLIISEPVSNLSSRKGLIGFIAQRAAKAGKGNEKFRYTAFSLTSIIKDYGKILNYKIVSLQLHGKDLILKLTKDGND